MDIIKIIKIIRLSDNKIFGLGDQCFVDDIFRGCIDGMQQFEDDFRVHIEVDEESLDCEYFSITELD